MRKSNECELCDGTGVIEQNDEDATYVHFAPMECDCQKEDE